MRSSIKMLGSFVLFAATAAAAQGQTDQGVGLSVTSLPGGSVALFNTPTEAQLACTRAGGGFGLREGKWVCMNARTALKSTRTAPPASPPRTELPQSVPPGIQVESVTLQPGESTSFILAPGFNHQLLRKSPPTAAGAITIRYDVVKGASRVVAIRGPGAALTFRVLADRDGNGGFTKIGEMTIPADGTGAARSWPGSLGPISVGEFRPATR
jgi:hypothetical protein